jgi:hypothetical protein
MELIGASELGGRRVRVMSSSARAITTVLLEAMMDVVRSSDHCRLKRAVTGVSGVEGGRRNRSQSVASYSEITGGIARSQSLVFRDSWRNRSQLVGMAPNRWQSVSKALNCLQSVKIAPNRSQSVGRSHSVAV